MPTDTNLLAVANNGLLSQPSEDQMINNRKSFRLPAAPKDLPQTCRRSAAEEEFSIRKNTRQRASRLWALKMTLESSPNGSTSKSKRRVLPLTTSVGHWTVLLVVLSALPFGKYNDYYNVPLNLPSIPFSSVVEVKLASGQRFLL